MDLDQIIKTRISEIKEKKINSLCRTCLKENTNLQPLTNLIFIDLTGISIELSIKNIITEVASIQILQNDVLPNYICSTCFLSLFNAFKFKRETEFTNKILNYYLSQKKLKNSFDGITYEEISLNNVEMVEILEEKEAVENNSQLINNSNDMILEDTEVEKNNVKKLFHCELCNKSYLYHSSLQNHIKNHTGEKDYLCTECGKQFKRIDDLKRHNLVHVKVLQFKCQICQKAFRHKYRLRVHYNSLHSDSKMLTCEICNEIFSDYDSLRDHVKLKHGKNYKPLTCTKCNAEFYDNDSFERHQAQHLVEVSKNNDLNTQNIYNETNTFKTHQCSSCGRTFATLSHLRLHERIHVQNYERPYKCTKCSKSFSRAKTLQKHYLKHDVDQPHLCCDCGETFEASDLLKKHVVDTHLTAKGRSHICQICSRGFMQAYHLEEHIQTHEKKKLFSCNLCHEKFNRRIILKTHEKTVHGLHRKKSETRQNNYQCNICDKIFVQSYLLNKHMYTHTGERPYKCQTCEKSFKQSGHLDIHVRIHTGDKPYICPVCSKGFGASCRLSVHMRSHTGERPYKCQICQKGYITSTALKVHTRSHTGEMPYTCPECLKPFARSEIMYRHRKIKHGFEKKLFP